MNAASFRLYGLLGLMTLIWSINYVAAKIGLRSFPALLFAPMRALIASAILVPLYFWAEHRYPHHATPWKREEVPVMVALGIFGIALNQLFFILGMARTTVAHASLIIATTPVQVLLLAWLRRQEMLSGRKLMGMMTAFAGIASLNIAPSRVASTATPMGDLLVFLASLTFALYTVVSREIAQQHGSITVNFFGFLAASLVMVPVGIWNGWHFDWTLPTYGGWLALVFMAACGSVLSYLIYNYALAKIPASRVASFSYSQPLIATAIGFAALGEPVTWRVVLGGTLVLSGVWLVGRS